MSRERTECACGKTGRFLRPGICAACYKAENRVYDPVAQKRYFDRWYAAQRAAGYPSYDWAARNAKRTSSS